jgi:hypothetical protein
MTTLHPSKHKAHGGCVWCGLPVWNYPLCRKIRSILCGPHMRGTPTVPHRGGTAPGRIYMVAPPDPSMMHSLLLY